MAQTGLLFNAVLLGVLFGSLVFFNPNWMIGWEYFSRAALALVILLGFFIERKRPAYKNNALIACLVLCLALLIWRHRQFSIYSTLHLMMGVLAMQMIAERSNISPAAIGRGLLGLVGASLILCLLQRVHLENFYAPNFDYEIAGFSGRPWILGCFAVMAIPFIAAVHPALLIVVLPLLFISRSSICILAGIISCVLMIKNKIVSIVLIGSGAIFTVVYALLGEGIESHRFQVWKNTFKYFTFFGKGLGGWLHTGFIHQNGADWYPWFWAHNEFYQWIFETGFAGGLLLAGFVVALMFAADTHLKRAMLYPLLILCFFHPVFHFGNIAVLAIFSLAFIHAKGDI